MFQLHLARFQLGRRQSLAAQPFRFLAGALQDLLARCLNLLLGALPDRLSFLIGLSLDVFGFGFGLAQDR